MYSSRRSIPEERTLEIRELGSTGIQLPALGLGCMSLIGWYGERDDVEAGATVAHALDRGVRHLDTAAVYQNGENERFVGECIRGRRDSVFLATKCGIERSDDGRIVVDNTPQTIRRSCDESLDRLGCDYIDLFYLHRLDPQVPLEDSIGAMAALVAAGKVRFIGLSEVSPDSLRRAHAIYPIAALQTELSLWTRRDSRAALDCCRELGIGFVAYSPLGRGFLTGSIRGRDDLPAQDTRRNLPRFSDDNLAANQAIAERMNALAARFECTPAQLALAWTLSQWRGVLAIPGTRQRRHLDDNLLACNLDLSAADLEFIEASLPETLVRGDRYPPGMLDKVNV